MLPIVNIGPLAIQTPGLILLAGIWLGFALMEKKYSRFGVHPETVNNLVMYGLIGLVIGGRVSYVAEHFSAFSKSPINLISLNPAMWDWAGGILIGLTVSALYGVRREVHFWPLMDALTPGAAAVMIAIPLMNLASGNAYGEPAQLPWSIYLWGAWRHPTQIYSALATLLILVFKVLLPLRKESQPDEQRPPGVFFLSFVAWSAAVQILTASFRVDAQLFVGLVRTAQIEAWLILALSLAFLWKRKKPESIEGKIIQSGINEVEKP